MWHALGHLLPLALALAVSSIPIMATILLLLSRYKSRSSVPYLIGWVIGIVAVVVVFTLLASAIPVSSHTGPRTIAGIALIIIGVALEVLAVMSWRRVRRNETAGEPKWLATVASFGPWSSLGLGFALNLRPKAILLSAAAGLSLRSDDLTFGETVIVIAVYTVIAASTVAVPVLATLFAPVKTEAWLLATHDWIRRNNRVVTILILAMIGVVVVGNGLTRL